MSPDPEFLASLEASGIYRNAQPALLEAPQRRQLMQRLESSLVEIL